MRGELNWLQRRRTGHLCMAPMQACMELHARMHGASCTRRRNEMIEWVMLGAGDGKWRGGMGSVGVSEG